EWYALVRAIELKEADASTSIHLVTVGGADAEPIIRKALALGGDEAIRINIEPTDPYQVAAAIAEVAKAGGYDLILTGKETIDYNNGAVGGMLAELLDMPYIALATNLQVAGSTATVKREIEGGEETAEVSLPVVLSCQKGMAEARIPNMRGIMAARTKPLKVVDSSAETLTEVAAFGLPPAKAGVKLVSPDQVEELVRMLHEEARVI
ncbi:MAG: electron transfer flavoprotein beta subunit/FixA family protein, partial [Chitinophagaceae bacterium]